MKFFLSASMAAALLAAGACRADDVILVPNNHGGYNVAQSGSRPRTIPFFGEHGFAARVNAESKQKPKFILRFVSRDDGHGNKRLVAKKLYYNTAEEAEAANAVTP